MMKRMAVLTSGGDAPGMNAAIRAVVQAGMVRGMDVFGVRYGYGGLMIPNRFMPLRAAEADPIISRGGTLLGSARCPEFKTQRALEAALRRLRYDDLEGLIVIGGNGSQAGAQDLSKRGFPVVGVPSTIDNDLCGTDISIGVDTALNTALESIDRLRVTASSHRRVFLVEVMGRHYGYLALRTAIASGAEAVVIPEMKVDPDALAARLSRAHQQGKDQALVVVAEGARLNATALARYFERHHEHLGFELRVTILGHVQRGGSPSSWDRLLATRLGEAAVDHLAAGRHGILVGLRGGRLISTPLSRVVGMKKPLDKDLVKVARAAEGVSRPSLR